MEQMLWNVEFEIMTSQYKHVATTCKTVVLALSYDDASSIVRLQWGKYDNFKLGSISPIGVARYTGIINTKQLNNA